MKINRQFTTAGQDVFKAVEWASRTSKISNPDGKIVFEMKDVQVPADWSQLATDIMVSKYFRKAGVPHSATSRDREGAIRGEASTSVGIGGHTAESLPDGRGSLQTGPETSAAQVIHRLAGCWRHWGETHNYFDSAEDAQAFYDELSYMMLRQMCAPNSPQWFNTGLHWAYGITGPAQGHFYCDPVTGEMQLASNAYEHPQPHACFIQSVNDDLVGPGGIMDLWTREARLFKYGSGTGSNYSHLRGEDEPLSGGGKSSGLMSFLKIGDRAAGAIKSGGTTRRAAKMVCLDLDHPDIESFVNWKVREELKVAALVEGMKVLPTEHKELAKKLGLKLDYDFNGESYMTVSGQNSNNSVRISNKFFEALEKDGDWKLIRRTDGKTAKTLKARDLWDQISFAAWRCADPGVQFDTTINQWHTCPASGRINASNPCVTGDTRVLTPGGIWRRIDSMIHLPARLITNLETCAVDMTEGAFPTGTKETFELKTTCGYTVKLTADHKIWTRQRGWVEAKSLTSEDELRLPAAPACLEHVADPTEPLLFQLAGLLLSDANGDLTKLGLEACVAEQAQQELLATYAQQNWEDNDSDTLTLALTNRRLTSRLHAFIRTEAGQKRLSDDAFTSGLPAQKHLLRGLFCADGEIVDGQLVLNSKSSILMQDVQTILLGFGIKSSVAFAGQRGSLRISRGCLAHFKKHIGFMGSKFDSLDVGPDTCSTRGAHFDTFASLRPLGMQQVFDLTEPRTSSFVANGITVHNCSEYMFLDDTACNLASLNVLTFYSESTRTFDIKRFQHGIRLWTIVLEISVLMASFPSEEIAKLSYRYRTLGLGYANLGAMLMQAGIAYDSEKGRAICAALSSILTGESYATSAEMAAQLGKFPGYAPNKEHMLRVIRNHKRAAYATPASDYESLDIKPVAIDADQFEATDSLANAQLLHVSRECWDRALSLGEKHGYRNAQTTVIAPTGTIGLLMDCDTTGVEPDFALVKFKKLAGGGYFKIANQSLRPALRNLNYTTAQINDILKYVMGTLTLDGSPHINRLSLKAHGMSDSVIARIEEGLPATFELSFAFSPWSLGEATMTAMGFNKDQWSSPSFNLLKKLGFTKKQIDEANDVICGRGTIEGAPLLNPEHLSVFDCANKCGKHGQRYIAPEGHIRMMAAAQPFISGAISKTINLPNEADLTAIKDAYQLSWELGLKANALYRDGSKLSQPLNVKSDDEIDDEESVENLESGREEVASQVAKAASAAANVERGLSNVEVASTIHNPQSTIVERVVEKIVNKPMRRRLADTRAAITHKFDVAGHEGYITVGLYDDGAPGEVFITMAKEGSTIGGLMDTIATLVSVSLQYGVPVDSLVRKFEHVRFEPNGMTRNPEIPIAKSLTDYIFRWLAMEFIPGYREANAPVRSAPRAIDQPRATPPATNATKTEPATPFDYGSGLSAITSGTKPPASSATHATPSHAAAAAADRPDRPDRSPEESRTTRLGLDAMSQQTTHLQSDAPPCDKCGSITVRSGTCYKCLNCGSSMGCS